MCVLIFVKPWCFILVISSLKPIPGLRGHGILTSVAVHSSSPLYFFRTESPQELSAVPMLPPLVETIVLHLNSASSTVAAKLSSQSQLPWPWASLTSFSQNCIHTCSMDSLKLAISHAFSSLGIGCSGLLVCFITYFVRVRNAIPQICSSL